MSESLLDDLFERRDQWRTEIAEAIHVVRAKERPWETNEQGNMQWYMHPALKDTSVRTMLVWRQEIPAGSHSGKQLMQGGIVHYVLQGTGYTVINGERLDWTQGDMIAFPLWPDGVEYQHFNVSPSEPVLMVATTMNVFEMFGVDQGSGFEQIENAPEFGKR